MNLKSPPLNPGVTKHFLSGSDNWKNNERGSYNHCVQYLQAWTKTLRKRLKTKFIIPCYVHGWLAYEAQNKFNQHIYFQNVIKEH